MGPEFRFAFAAMAAAIFALFVCADRLADRCRRLCEENERLRGLLRQQKVLIEQVVEAAEERLSRGV